MIPDNDPAGMAMHPYSGVPLILISGVGRSGTTALRESLGLHPGIHSTERENNIIYDMLDAAKRNCTSPSRRYAMRVTDGAYDAAFRGLLLSLLWPAARAKRPAALLAFSDLTPSRADYLVRLFPGVRIVYGVRNGIEVVASRLRFHGFAGMSFEANGSVWSGAMRMASWGEGRRDFRVVRHERLIDPEGLSEEVRELFEFLGLSEHAACEENLRTKTYHPTPDYDGGATSALNERAERWRDWSEEELGVFTEVCGPAMEYFGYPMPWRDGAGVAGRRRAG